MAGLCRATGKTLWKRPGTSTGSTSNLSDDNDNHGGERENNDDEPNLTPKPKPHLNTNSPNNSANSDDDDDDDNGNDDTGNSNNNDPPPSQEIDALFEPLIYTTTTSTTSSSKLHNWRTAAVPSVDGRVYLTPGNTNTRKTSNHKQRKQHPRQRNHSSKHKHTMTEMTATTTVRELVQRAPFVDARGRFYVGSRHAFAFALDQDTGEVLRVVSGNTNQNRQSSGGGGGRSNLFDNDDDRDQEGDKERNVVWVGRVDHSVSIYDARSGEMDVQFSTAEVLSVNDMVTGRVSDAAIGMDGFPLASIGGVESTLFLPGRQDESEERDSLSDAFDLGSLSHRVGSEKNVVDDSDGEGRKQRQHSTTSPTRHSDSIRSPIIVATPGGKLAMRDPDTGFIIWISNETFDTPVAFALESKSGSTLNVDIVPDAPMPNSPSKDYLSSELERQLAALEGVDYNSNTNDEGGIGDETVVGALTTGQLFALSMGRERRSIHNNRPQNGLPHLPTPSSTIRSTSSHDLSNFLQYSQQHQLGMQPYNTYSSDEESMALSKVFGNHNSFLDPHPAGPLLTYLMAEKYFPFSDALKLAEDVASSDIVFDHTQGSHDKENKRFRSWKMIMSSWIPPAVALAFVLSFELGRRERARVDQNAAIAATDKSPKHQNVVDLVKKRIRGEGSTSKEYVESSTVSGASDSPALLDDTGNDSSINATLSSDVVAITNSKEDRRIGVIQVSEEVLGFGGHGTVVYRGKLDGRNVAVKRMLKAYHASADREISLLIESDGHPNVVRYFLKEARGDFVYLALELCDMSLQDLIIALSKQRMKMIVERQKKNPNSELTPCSGIEPATKKTLFQIASGVKHIHSLRIVHRDLKPQNILLAHKGRGKVNLQTTEKVSDDDPIYHAFEGDEYVPKISDMGLGKQLTGQSSFGLSTMNNSLGLGVAPGEDGSTIAGAGPGSVGWQAPEVMAQRWFHEPTAHTNINGNESMREASPMDVSLNVRTSRSVDIFSLGCIFYCTIVPGSHPFGEWYEREANIMKNKPSTEALDELSFDAANLVKAMIHRDPKARPTASQVCNHPFFWSATKRLTFLCDLSDRLEAEALLLSTSGVNGYVLPSNVLDPLAIESQAAKIVGTAWDRNLDPDLLNNVARFRTYDPSSVRDCLRIIRNKHHHFDELTSEIKETLGSNQEGLLRYFESRFPRLLMHCYKACQDNLLADDVLAVKYEIQVKRLLLQKNSETVPPKKAFVEKTINFAESSQNVYEPLMEVSSSSIITEKDDNEDRNNKSSEEIQGAASPKAQKHSEVSESIDDGTSNKNIESTAAIKSDYHECPPSPTSTSNSDDLQHVSGPHVPVSCIIEKDSPDIVLWEGSNAAKAFNCRGWMRSKDEWIRRSDMTLRKRDANVARCAEDPKFRTRLCNHWDVSQGTFCSMRKKNKCVFAHGPIELRVKEGKRNRWGKLVDKNGNNSNPYHSGGEDTFGAARSIETVRQAEGKWNTEHTAKKGKKRGAKKIKK